MPNLASFALFVALHVTLLVAILVALLESVAGAEPKYIKPKEAAELDCAAFIRPQSGESPAHGLSVNRNSDLNEYRENRLVTGGK